jgi:hypothetical protein
VHIPKNLNVYNVGRINISRKYPQRNSICHLPELRLLKTAGTTNVAVAAAAVTAALAWLVPAA